MTQSYPNFKFFKFQFFHFPLSEQHFKVRRRPTSSTSPCWERSPPPPTAPHGMHTMHAMNGVNGVNGVHAIHIYMYICPDEDSPRTAPRFPFKQAAAATPPSVPTNAFQTPPIVIQPSICNDHPETPDIHPPTPVLVTTPPYWLVQ